MYGEIINPALREWLFEDHRLHPKIYDVKVRDRIERTVSIRMGLSWPQPDKAGYFVLVAQLEPTREDKTLGRNRFLAFKEGESPILNTLFEKIGDVCSRTRVDSIYHGDEEGDSSFSGMLNDYLRNNGKDYPNIPTAWKSWRSKDTNFLVQVVRNYIANRELIFFNITDNRTPKLIEKIQQVNEQSDILKIPEIRALSYVMDDFNCSPWTPPAKEEKREKVSPWV
jgi:hypothetical protein